MTDFSKIVRIGAYLPEWWKTPLSVFCKIQFSAGKLSISGVEGPTSNGNCIGGCGQIYMHMGDYKQSRWTFAQGWDADTLRRFLSVWGEWHLNDMRAYDSEMRAAGWHKLACKKMAGHEFTLTREAYRERDAAKNAAVDALAKGETFTPTPEQTAATIRPYSYTAWVYEGEAAPEPAPHYEPAKTLKGDRKTPDSKTLGWLRPSDHPDGLLGRKLREDSPGFGSAWFREEVPTDVLDFLRSLPDTDKTPAWV